jgi:amino acid transporter
VFLGSIAMLAFLLTIASFSFGRADGVLFYVAVAAASSIGVVVLMGRDVRRRRAAGELPARRVPRRPITFPLRETVLTFAVWYVVAVAIDRAITGTTNVFTLIAIAPFASFMLTTLTIAGRHMAFRLTAEDVSDGEGGEARSARGR